MNGNVPRFSLLKFRTLIRNDRGPDSPVTEVLHTQEELDQYIESCQDKSRPSHAVDFPEERAIAVALGPRPRAGYVVEILAVVQETGGVVGVQNHVLFVEHIHQGPGADVITYPHHVVRVRGLSGIVSFRQVPDTFGQLVLPLLGGPMARQAGQAGQAGMAGQAGQAGQAGMAAMPAMAATGAAVAPAQQPSMMPLGGQGGVTTLPVGEEGPPATTLAVGEEGPPPTTLAIGEEVTTLAVGEEGPPPTTLAIGEEVTTLAVGEEATTLAVGEEGPFPTTLAVGEEGPFPTTLAIGEEVTTLAIGEEVTTLAIGEEVTTLAIGEEGPAGGGMSGAGPFG